MAIRSVESLREKLRRDTNPLEMLMSLPATHRFLESVTVEGYEAALDGVEREVAERFIELPTDADGVPIHPGDVMRYHEYVFEVKEMTHAEGMWSVSDMSDTVARPCELAHHEPTVEDVLWLLIGEYEGCEGTEEARACVRRFARMLARA